MAEPKIVVLISANSEWRAVKEILSPRSVQSTPLGETFSIQLDTGTPGTGSRDTGALDTVTRDTETRFFHGGWGKISAAATTQYVIDHYRPDLLINLGTCGGFEGRIQRGTIILVTKTIVYDIVEQMSDEAAAIEHYSTDLDLSWLMDGGPQTVDQNPSSIIQRPSSKSHSLIPDTGTLDTGTLDTGTHDTGTRDTLSSIVRGLLVSADRDIIPTDIPLLVEKYGAVAADWESGAIAWVAKRNGVRCLILRGVTDLVSAAGGEAYGDIEIFHENTRKVMEELIEHLPDWLSRIRWQASDQAPLFNKVDCIELHVPDLESGLSFYRDKLEHPLTWRTAVAAGLRMPGSDAEIVLQTERPRQEVDLLVDSADEAAQSFVQAGGTMIVPPFDIQIGRACVVRDPWGNQLVLLDFSKGMLKTDEEGKVME